MVWFVGGVLVIGDSTMGGLMPHNNGSNGKAMGLVEKMTNKLWGR